ncbi:hypothetical protein PSN45_001708 [Yamadazyma tenuis]|uniref:uncharacterized protein n=1 Tax=Candida tenuis TaxID=2315449 RepID=UPI00279D5AC5|nr:hypothetical protein PSN45_001708 [Yamadazyma tenuis]
MTSSGLRRSNPPFSPLTICRADPMILALLEYTDSVLVQEKWDNSVVLNNEYSAIEKKFSTKSDMLDGFDDVKPYETSEKESFKIGGDSTSDEAAVSLARSSLEVLPVRKAIWRYINVYFSKIYPYCPTMDQRAFMDTITKIIGTGEPNETRIETLHINRRIDFAHLGILLIMLRLSYLTITSHSFRTNGELQQPGSDLAYLVNHPIDIKVVAVSKRCMDCFHLYSTTSIPVLQLVLLHRVYFILAPEEGDSGRESEVYTYNNVINGMTYALGLNRESVFTYNTGPDSRHRNLCRKIWLSVYGLNVGHCLRNGYRLPIEPDSYDTLLPDAGSEVTSIYDADLENVVLDVFSRSKLEPEVPRILELVSNVRKGAPLVELCSLLEYFERTYLESYGVTRKEIMEGSFPHELERLYRASIYLTAIGMDITILMMVFNYYMKKDDIEIQSFYLNKLIVTVCYDFLPFCCEIFQNGGKIFKEFGDISIFPVILSMLYKAAIVLCSIHFRNKKALSTFCNDAEVCDILTQTNTILLKNLRNITDIFLYFSPWYFSAWKSSRNLVVVYDLMTGEGLYEFHSMRNAHGFSFPKSHFKKTLDVLRTSSEEWNQYRTTNEQGKEVFTFQTRALVNPTVEGPSEVSPATFLDTRKEVDSRWHETLASRSGMQPPSEDRSKWSAELQDELLANDISRLFDSALVDDFFATYLNDQP